MKYSRIIETRYTPPAIKRAATVIGWTGRSPKTAIKALPWNGDAEMEHSAVATTVAKDHGLAPLILERLLYDPVEGVAVFRAREGS